MSGLPTRERSLGWEEMGRKGTGGGYSLPMYVCVYVSYVYTDRLSVSYTYVESGTREVILMDSCRDRVFVTLVDGRYRSKIYSKRSISLVVRNFFTD